MSDFKIGDRLRCLMPDYPFSRGDVVEVVRLHPDDTRSLYLRAADRPDDDEGWGCLARNFTLDAPAPPAPRLVDGAAFIAWAEPLLNSPNGLGVTKTVLRAALAHLGLEVTDVPATIRITFKDSI